MGKKQPDLEPPKVLKRFRQSTLKYGVKRTILSGSQITGEAGECSDVNILVASSNKNKLGLVLNSTTSGIWFRRQRTQ